MEAVSPLRRDCKIPGPYKMPYHCKSTEPRNRALTLGSLSAQEIRNLSSQSCQPSRLQPSRRRPANDFVRLFHILLSGHAKSRQSHYHAQQTQRHRSCIRLPHASLLRSCHHPLLLRRVVSLASLGDQERHPHKRR